MIIIITCKNMQTFKSKKWLKAHVSKFLLCQKLNNYLHFVIKLFPVLCFALKLFKY
jgi:hypothetical protein